MPYLRGIRLFNLSIFFSLVVLLTASPAISAPFACRQIFITSEAPPSPWLTTMQGLETSIYSGLTPQMKSLLIAHPVWQKYGRSGGRGLHFVFSFGENTYLREREIRSGEKGESIQAHFVATTLKELFPEAEFYGPPGSYSKHTIDIAIVDPHEQGFESLRGYVTQYGDARKSYLPMPLLKIANGRAITESKTEIRNRLQIPKDWTVLNSYNLELSKVGLGDLLGKMRESSMLNIDKSIILVSERFINNSQDGQHRRSWFINQENIPAKIHLLSEVDPSLFKTAGPHVVINDTMGNLPVLHRLSDVSLIGGPVNLFEGINAGTPVVFQRNILTGQDLGYNIKGYLRMVRVAESSGSAFPFSTKEDLIRGIENSLKDRPVATASYLLSSRGKTWFDHYLYSLKSILDRQVSAE